MHVDIKPELLIWARERAGLNLDVFGRRFPKLAAWEQGNEKPTLKQIENFAKATHTPIGYLFLKEPPQEPVPIPDYRTIKNVFVGHPSPDLLEIIYICQQRQRWYRDFALSAGEKPLQFVGSVNISSKIEKTAENIRQALKFDIEERHQCSTWTDALRRFIDQADSAGILTMCSDVVLNNNHRRLDPEEFRGFALSDAIAPLVFINGADTKAAQMFTLAHELAHIWLGQSAVSDAQALSIPENKIEHWCNKVAAELLVPIALIRKEFGKNAELNTEIDRLARLFKVSTLVIIRRIYDAGGITTGQFHQTYSLELEKLKKIPAGSGGNFYLTQAARVSKRFARALVANTLEGQTLYREAFQMLGFSKITTFNELGRLLGVI